MTTSHHRKVLAGALALGVPHFLVDAAGGFLVWSDLPSPDLALPFATHMLLYTLLAFAAQAPMGWLVDLTRSWSTAALAGALLAALALVLGPRLPTSALVMVTLGNGLLHVGIGAMVLRASGHRAAPSGLVVGPGAVGVLLGGWAAGHHLPARWPILVLLLLTTWWALRQARHWLPPVEPPALPRLHRGAKVLAVGVLGLLLVSVTIRALGGGGVAGMWREVSPTVLLLLAVAASLGKMTGGFLGDRLGWAPVAGVVLVASAPLIGPLAWWAPAAVVGMLLFQMAMPITLKATHHLFPRWPGLAFGLPVLALAVGGLPKRLDITLPIDDLGRAALALSAAVLIAMALGGLQRLGGSLGPRSRASSARPAQEEAPQASTEPG